MKVLKSFGGDKFDSGVRSVLAIRCMEHRAVAQLNTAEVTGAECPICAITEMRSALRRAVETIRVFHGEPAWPEYQQSPEMKQINGAIERAEKGAA